MIKAEPTKKYGLIIPKQTKAPAVSTVFSNADEDDQESDNPVKKAGPVGSVFQRKVKQQTKLEIEKALAEDPSVFDYDGVYDDLQQQREDTASQKREVDRQPKYIHQLLKAAEKRKLDYEKHLERQIQKEREAEGDEFADKDAFVTNAYRQKLIELKKLEEEERRKDALDAACDVTKQNDLSGFYRHILNETARVPRANAMDASKESCSMQPPTAEQQLSSKKVHDRSYRRSQSSISTDNRKQASERAQSPAESFDDQSSDTGRCKSPPSNQRKQDAQPNDANERPTMDSSKNFSKTAYKKEPSDDRHSDRRRDERPQSKDDRYSGDRHRDDRHMEDRRQNDRHRDDYHRDDRHRDDRHREDRHREDRHKDDRHRDDRHREDRHREDRHREDRHRSDRHRDHHRERKDDDPNKYRHERHKHDNRSMERQPSRESPASKVYESPAAAADTSSKCIKDLEVKKAAAAEQRQRTLEEVKQLLARHHSDEEVRAARERYLARRAERQLAAAGRTAADA